MWQPGGVGDAACSRLKRMRLSFDGGAAAAAATQRDGEQGSSGEPAGGAGSDGAPRSPDGSRERLRDAGGSDGTGGEGGASGSDGNGSVERLCGMLRRTKSIGRLGSEASLDGGQAGAAPPPLPLCRQLSQPAEPPAPARVPASDVWDFLRQQELDSLCTMAVTDPLSWELWAFGELNCTLSAHFADVASFALQPLHAYPQAPRAAALAAFLADVPRGPAARLTHVLLHRTFRGCHEAEIVRYKFRCPPCLAEWAKRHRVPVAAAQLFAVTGVDTTTGEGCTLYVPHMPAMSRAGPPAPATGGAAAAAAAAPPVAAATSDESCAPPPQHQQAPAQGEVLQQRPVTQRMEGGPEGGAPAANEGVLVSA